MIHALLLLTAFPLVAICGAVGIYLGCRKRWRSFPWLLQLSYWGGVFILFWAVQKSLIPGEGVGMLSLTHGIAKLLQEDANTIGFGLLAGWYWLGAISLLMTIVSAAGYAIQRFG